MAGTFHYQPIDLQDELRTIVDQIVQPGKGIFSTDETPEMMAEKLESMCLSNSKEIRKQYSKLRYTLDDSMGDYISAVVMSEEDLGESDGCEKFIDVLKKKNMMIGVNASMGSENSCSQCEDVSQGLDGLYERCKEFKSAGVSMLKWRVSFRMGANTPSSLAIFDNANAAARFSAICQANGLVPLIEIDLASKGSHCIYSSQMMIEKIMSSFCKHLLDHNVFLEGVILSPTFALPGTESSMFCDANAIACSTVKALRRSVPGAIAGIVLLFSGLPIQEVVTNLKAVNSNNAYKPWPISFNLGSKHPDQVLAIWQGKPDRVKDAQSYLLKAMADASQASKGSEC